MTAAPNGMSWGCPPAALRLDGDDVHVWLAGLDCPAAVMDRLESTLSDDERSRADRFHFSRDRRRFVCARGVLRQLLAEYLDAEASQLAFRYGSHGKPALDAPSDRNVVFNVSHSGEFALLAFSGRGDIGVDLEAFRTLDDRDDIAARFFAAGEVDRLRAMPAVDQDAAFFRCWTRKEAYVKAVGDGLSLPLDRFEVTFSRGEADRLTVLDDERESGRWSVLGLEPPAGYAAALVTEGRRRVNCWRWTNTRVSQPDYAGEAV